MVPAILAAGRKGLQTEPSGAEIADLWKATSAREGAPEKRR